MNSRPLYLRGWGVTSGRGPACISAKRQYNDDTMTRLEKISLSTTAAELDRPFSTIHVATVGDLAVSLYICQGSLEWHKHLDTDELFWVYQGGILLESEWGDVRLRSGELTVVPKGVGHRSSSDGRASVLLLRSGMFSERKNGRRRIYAIAGEAKLKHVSSLGVVRTLTMPFHFRTVARVEEASVQVGWGHGTWPVDIPAAADVLLLAQSGTATVRTDQSMVHLHPGDLTVVPEGSLYHLSTTRGTALAQVTIEDVDAEG